MGGSLEYFNDKLSHLILTATFTIDAILSSTCILYRNILVWDSKLRIGMPYSHSPRRAQVCMLVRTSGAPSLVVTTLEEEVPTCGK